MEDIQTSKENIKEDAPKKGRLRLKKICSQIRDQMEFYFSDANLHKDRFLKKLISQSEDGFVELAVFAKFNKLKALTDDMNLVAKALTTSHLLEVSEDKQKVRRKKPLSDQKDVDDRTVYVECLPLKADHEWVKRIFQSCGKVVYVSLPKYKSTGDFKGFGFVEFETVDGAKKACEMLNNPPSTAGEKVGKFPRANKQIKQLEKQLKSQDGDPRDPRLARSRRRQRTVSEGTVSEDGVDKTKWRKRRRTISEGTDQQDLTPNQTDDTKPSSPKRSKVDINSKSLAVESLNQSNTNVSDNPTLEQSTDSRKRKLSDSNSEISSETDVDNQVDAASISKKVRISEEVEAKSPEEKKTKRRRKRVKKKESVKQEIPELRVISKHKWLELKNEYLHLQKACMNQLKKTLRGDRVLTTSDNMVIHGDVADAGDTEKQKGRQIEYVADVIIKVTKNGETFTRKEVKEHASKLAAVAYVDVKDGDIEGYIRCQSSEDAASLSKADSEPYTYNLLQGEAEKEYWHKIQRDREQKLNSKSKSHPQRGRDKKLKKAEKIMMIHQRKHVIFDDD